MLSYIHVRSIDTYIAFRVSSNGLNCLLSQNVQTISPNVAVFVLSTCKYSERKTGNRHPHILIGLRR